VERIKDNVTNLQAGIKQKPEDDEAPKAAKGPKGKNGGSAQRPVTRSARRRTRCPAEMRPEAMTATPRRRRYANPHSPLPALPCPVAYVRRDGRRRRNYAGRRIRAAHTG
jgi:hypothetical protein